MSPNWSVNRNMLPCFRTWTLPRSVAFSIGSTRGSKKRTPAARSFGDRGSSVEPPPRSRFAPVRRAPAGPADAASVAVASGSAMRGRGSRAIVTPKVRELVRLVGHDEGVDELVDVAGEDRGQVVDRDPDPVVGHPVLRVVVRPDLLGSIACADHQLAG